MGMYELKQGQYKIIYIRGSQQLVARNSSKKTMVNAYSNVQLTKKWAVSQQ